MHIKWGLQPPPGIVVREAHSFRRHPCPPGPGKSAAPPQIPPPQTWNDLERHVTGAAHALPRRADFSIDRRQRGRMRCVPSRDPNDLRFRKSNARRLPHGRDPEALGDPRCRPRARVGGPGLRRAGVPSRNGRLLPVPGLSIDDQVVRRAVRKAPSGGVLSEEQTNVIRVQMMVIAPREIVNPSEPFWE